MDAGRSESLTLEGNPCRVVVAGNDVVFTQALALRLDGEPSVRVVAVAPTIDDAVRVAVGGAVDVVLVDGGPAASFDAETIRMFVARAAERDQPFHVVAMSWDADARAAAGALMAGARGFVPASSDVDVLLRAIHGACAGETHLPADLLTGVMAWLRAADHPPVASGPLDRLTARERELLTLLASGVDRRAIARTLGLSENTVRTHIRRVLAKLDVHSTLEAVSVAWRSGAAPGGRGPQAERRSS